MTLQEQYQQRAMAMAAKGHALFGWPPGPIYNGNVRALLDPHLHDFRLSELPPLVGDVAYLQQRRSILDLGCGPGTFVYRALGLGHDAWGIDLDADKIDIARFRVDVDGHPPAWKERVLVADATDMPFANESFDLVSSCQVLEHIEELPQALFEAVRVMKRGGWLDLRAPDYRWSYDNHYSMTWPRFMPRAHALRWAQAMGRPSGGVGTFFYVTMPQVISILEGLRCRIRSATLWLHEDAGPRVYNGTIGEDPIFFRSAADIGPLAAEIQRLSQAGQLPDMYSKPLEFTIIAQRT